MFSDGSSFYVPCVWSHCRQTNQNYLTVSLTRPVSCVPDKFFFLLLLFLINLLELLSFGELYLFDDEYDNDGSGSGSPGTCDFPFCSGKSVGPVIDVDSGDCVPNGIKSIGDVVTLVVLVPRVFKSKCG